MGNGQLSGDVVLKGGGAMRQLPLVKWEDLSESARLLRCAVFRKKLN